MVNSTSADYRYAEDHEALDDMAMEMSGSEERDRSSIAGATIKRKPGRPPIDNPRQAVSLRLEPEVLEKFRATGPGWQRRMNDVLKAAKV